MPDTVFYAWQCDLPAKTNRKFIRGGIDDALQAINQELGVDEALRADQDTQGVPGDVNVAEVIFEKIDRCRIFVADITTTKPPEAPRPALNPNVLVEYGRASARPGSAAVVQVFNEAFGDWQSQRPFDLRHRRKPVLYRLEPATSAKVRESMRKALAAELGRVFRDILSAGQPTAPLPNISEFISLRRLYERTPVGLRETARIMGFWCGLVPAGQTLGPTALWDRPELLLRVVCYEVRRGHAALSFETMDAMQINRRDRRAFEGNQGDTSFDPMQVGAQFLHRYPYTSRPGGSEVMEDVAAVYIMEGGRVVLNVRTDNLTPVPNLNVRWVIADLISALAIMQRVRVAAGRPFAPWSSSCAMTTRGRRV